MFGANYSIISNIFVLCYTEWLLFSSLKQFSTLKFYYGNCATQLLNEKQFPLFPGYTAVSELVLGFKRWFYQYIITDFLHPYLRWYKNSFYTAFYSVYSFQTPLYHFAQWSSLSSYKVIHLHSKLPFFNSAYLLRVLFRTGIAVHQREVLTVSFMIAK